MKYFVVFGVLIACIVSALLGFTLGINLNPESTTTYVLSWGSLGDWVAGIGAFFAVGVALWQTHQMRREDVEKLSINQRQIRGNWAISIVSCGRRPSKVIGVGLYSKKNGVTLPLKSFIFNDRQPKFPITLDYSDSLELFTAQGRLLDLAVAATHSFNGDIADVELIVQTTMTDFKRALPEETKAAIINAGPMFFAGARAP